MRFVLVHGGWQGGWGWDGVSALLRAGGHEGKIFDGTWRTADGGVRAVVEPATGDQLGTVGFAALSDLERSALRTREAQVAWAAAPIRERAAVLRRAAELWAKYSDDIQGWLIRESGGTRVKTARELRDAVDECNTSQH